MKFKKEINYNYNVYWESIDGSHALCIRTNGRKCALQLLIFEGGVCSYPIIIEECGKEDISDLKKKLTLIKRGLRGN